MANAGSCKIGFKPVPSFGIGDKFKKGFEVKRINNKKPRIITSWKSTVSNLYLEDSFFEFIKNINKKIDKTKSHSNKLPSWLPHVPEIL